MTRFLLLLLTLITATALAFVAFYKGDITLPISEAELQRAVDAKLIEIGTYDEDGVRVENAAIQIDMTDADLAQVTAKADVDALGLELALDARLESGVMLKGSEVYLTNIRAADLQITERGAGGRSVGLGGLIGGLLGDGAGKEIAEEALDKYLADIPLYDIKDAPGWKAAIARGVLKDVRVAEDKLIVTASLEAQRARLIMILSGILLLCLVGLLGLWRKRGADAKHL